MTYYQVIARKFRPKTFSEVCGQDSIVQTIKNSITLNRTSHAYLFCGPRGTGKTTLARIFAKALNCTNPTSEGEPCNACDSCKEINRGCSLDVLEIDGASNRGIDDIRQINETVGYTPSSGQYKVYIIDEVHMLTKEAFNALLKTLEEPPAKVKFFLATTEPHKVLSTISSRCLRFDLSRIPDAIMREKLQAICEELQTSIDPKALELVSQKAEGSLRDAQSMLDQLLCYSKEKISQQDARQALGFVSEDIFRQIDTAFSEKNTKAAFSIAQSIFSSGMNYSFFFDSLSHYFKEIFLSYSTQKHPTYSLFQCEKILQILTEIMIQKPFQKKVQLEIALLKILNVSKEISIDELIKRLSLLEKQPPLPEPALSLPPEKVESPPKPPVESVSLSSEEQTKFDNLVRFAAVELNGSLEH